jgi:hypothetical protein
MEVQSKPQQKVLETLSGKNTTQNRAGRVAQVMSACLGSLASIGPEYKPQYCQKKKKEHN